MCGTTRARDARAAISLGVDALGFIFVRKSPRCIEPERAAEIIAQLPPFVSRVGVFVDSEIEKLKAKADKAEADTQLKYYKQIEEIRSMQESAANKLVELKDAGDDAWEDLKAGIDNAWDSLGSAVKLAASRFN